MAHWAVKYVCYNLQICTKYIQHKAHDTVHDFATARYKPTPRTLASSVDDCPVSSVHGDSVIVRSMCFTSLVLVPLRRHVLHRAMSDT